jgi:hypothetical protein
MHARGTRFAGGSRRGEVRGRARGYPMQPMEDVLSLIGLTLYVVGILALSMALTYAVVRISPSESAKEQKAKAKEAQGG